MEGHFTTKAAPRLNSVVQYQMGTHVNRMTPHGGTGSPLALEAFLHLHTGPHLACKIPEGLRTQVLPGTQHAFSWRVWHSV